MLSITMSNLFHGFIRNYGSFGLRHQISDVNWTHEILGFYSRLGQMLGCYVQYEWRRFDLVWFWDLKDMKDGRPLLHVEHENNRNRLGELISKIRDSLSENIVVIAYPDSESQLHEFVKSLESLAEGMNESIELLAILDTIYISSDRHSITGYMFEGGKGLVGELQARRMKTVDEMFYAEPG